LVNEALCAENCLGRWIWKSGDILHSAQVPWEVQAINTCPDNFLWEKNKSAIVTVAPGLYQISFGFYQRKAPVVRIFVNGEVIFTVNSSSAGGSGTAVSYAEGKENFFGGNSDQVCKVNKHSAGNITGLTLSEFVALPARARLTVCYESETSGEGFLSVRKL